MRAIIPVLLAAMMGSAQAIAQTPPADCPPGTTGAAPQLDKEGKRVEPDKNLSQELAESGGIVCPPAGVDPEMQKKPPEGGELRVIPPPGSPGGEPGVKPK